MITLLLAAMITTTAESPQKDHLDWWREAKFGMFIHWGLYAVPAGEWEGKQIAGIGEWILNSAKIKVEDYEALQKQFNPVKFNAKDWVDIAKSAGMKYIVITSKHHDGFCLFDSNHTDHDVMSTPFKRDIMKELADACHAQDLRICWYHSIMDWHHPDYLPRRGWEQRSVEGADFDRYVKHLRGQVEELLTNYGDIGVMWFDGEWEASWLREYGRALYDLCRTLQPDVLVNNRVDKGRGGMAGMTARGFAGDFGTPEQEIPSTGLPDADWETCMTMNRHWGYNKHDHDYKSVEDLIHKLVDIASKGGNFLLNVGPTAEGEFPPESVERLAAIGRWMKVNGSSIYGTTASPFSALPWGRCTVRTDGGTTTLYLHVFDWPDDGELVLSGLGNQYTRAYLLTQSGRDLAVTRGVADIRISVPANAPDPVCSVVALEITGKPVVYERPRIRAASTIMVRPLDVELSTTSNELAIHYTLDGTDPGSTSPRYEAPLRFTDTTIVKARVFHRGRPVSGVAESRFTRVTPRPAVAAVADDWSPGLRCEVFEGTWDRLPDFRRLRPVFTETVSNFRLPPGPTQQYIGRRYLGYLSVPRDDVYEFSLTCDDGARLSIGAQLVVDNDGLHGSLEARGRIALAAGAHPITVEYFNKTGGAGLDVALAPIGAGLDRIPDASLRH